MLGYLAYYILVLVIGLSLIFWVLFHKFKNKTFKETKRLIIKSILQEEDLNIQLYVGIIGGLVLLIYCIIHKTPAYIIISGLLALEAQTLFIYLFSYVLNKYTEVFNTELSIEYVIICTLGFIGIAFPPTKYYSQTIILCGFIYCIYIFALIRLMILANRILWERGLVKSGKTIVVLMLLFANLWLLISMVIVTIRIDNDAFIGFEKFEGDITYSIESLEYIVTIIYYVVMTFSTVGYGEIHPNTWLGQTTAIMISLSSIACLVIFAGSFMSRESSQITEKQADGITKKKTG